VVEIVWAVLGQVAIFRISFKVTHNTTLAPGVEKTLQVSHGLLLAWTQFLQIKDAMELARLVYLRFDPCIVPAPRRPRCS
jgi:hypothetical protein